MRGGDWIALIIIAAAIWAFVEWMVAMSREWQRILDEELADRQEDMAEMTTAEAICPEFAASRRGPRVD